MSGVRLRSSLVRLFPLRSTGPLPLAAVPILAAGAVVGRILSDKIKTLPPPTLLESAGVGESTEYCDRRPSAPVLKSRDCCVEIAHVPWTRFQRSIAWVDDICPYGTPVVNRSVGRTAHHCSPLASAEMAESHQAALSRVDVSTEKGIVPETLRSLRGGGSGERALRFI